MDKVWRNVIMTTTRIVRNGSSQTVTLPDDCKMDAEEVFVAKVDDMVILYPREKGWDLLVRAIEGFTDDFMADRDQPDKPEERESL